MNEVLTKTINIFLTVDLQTIHTYFNKHDPAPLYKRQLSHQFEGYIMTSVAKANKYSIVFYKLKCTNDIDKQYAEPLMYAVRRHFTAKKILRQAEFTKFKRQSFILLIVSLLVAIVCQGVVPFFMDHSDRVQSIIITSLDVLSWVVLWKPIDKLIFEWNPHLHDITILDKLVNAEMMIIDEKKETIRQKDPVLFAISQTG